MGKLNNMQKKNGFRGFTMIEMMVTVAIIGILAAIAYPSYMASIRKSNRAEAKTELADVAQRLQRCYSTYGQFDDPQSTNLCTVFEQLTDIAPAYITTRGSGYYRITYAVNPPAVNPPSADIILRTTFLLTATAVLSPQTADTIDGCNALTLDEKGIRGPIPNGSTESPCW